MKFVTRGANTTWIMYFNPVKHGLAARAVDWPWSSFHRLVKQGVYPEDWGNNVVAESR